ncbi:MAG: hypothetical protein AVDCRST_MAG49-2563 [uncultured Thermomicrobiales bacterium]|uniref:Pyridoxamine 5'-phosphate oxidase N-terminal domain-containing protein n=1 Tax=uncultured Thermomicrobiales bacterium TaxID=1645740 RepID=A0A6J4UZ70_9BACT|nr:MAG: hypothetical protein AVDCRST_MAG49-2563 [uncultured Thermomicrobiales bacterium]
MNEQERDRFLDQPLVGAIATVRADGAPAVVPVWYRWHAGTVLVWSEATFPWVRRLADEPRVALAVFEHTTPLRAVYVRGTATVRTGSLAELWDEIRPIVARYVPAEEVESTMASYDTGDAKAMVTITPTSIRAQANAG